MRVFDLISAKNLLALALLSLTPVAAEAATFTFDGQTPSGTDPLGGTYTVGTSFGGLVQFQETAGLQPDPTQQVLFDPAGSGLLNATSFTLTITGSTAQILPLDRGFGDYFQTFSADGTLLADWTGSVNDAGTAITYTADAGNALLAGERFGTITTFVSGGVVPADFAYTITWSGDAASAVPEPATWALMLFGFGCVGQTMRRRRATVFTA